MLQPSAPNTDLSLDLKLTFKRLAHSGCQMNATCEVVTQKKSLRIIIAAASRCIEPGTKPTLPNSHAMVDCAAHILKFHAQQDARWLAMASSSCFRLLCKCSCTTKHKVQCERGFKLSALYCTRLYQTVVYQIVPDCSVPDCTRL